MIFLEKLPRVAACFLLPAILLIYFRSCELWFDILCGIFLESQSWRRNIWREIIRCGVKRYRRAFLSWNLWVVKISFFVSYIDKHSNTLCFVFLDCYWYWDWNKGPEWPVGKYGKGGKTWAVWISSLDQSIDQWNSQSINETVNQSISQLINRSVNQQINRTDKESIKHRLVVIIIRFTVGCLFGYFSVGQGNRRCAWLRGDGEKACHSNP